MKKIIFIAGMLVCSLASARSADIQSRIINMAMPASAIALRHEACFYASINEHIKQYGNITEEEALEISGLCIQVVFKELDGASITVAMDQGTRLILEIELKDQRVHYREYINSK